jgi:uncharacterized protein YigE (DUF2233 family)
MKFSRFANASPKAHAWRRGCISCWLVLQLAALGTVAATSALAGPVAEPASAKPERHDDGLWTCQLALGQQRLRAFYTDQHGVRFGHMQNLVEWLAQSHEQLQCATNGAIYAVGGRPLGWLVADGVLLNPINHDTTSPGNFFMQPNGALIIDDGGARIETTQALEDDAPADVSHIQLALQSGPLLLQDGTINQRFDAASTSQYTRNAICVVNPSHVILAYSERLLNLYQFAHELQQLGCRQALYLDGHLSQMYPSQAQLEPAQRRSLSVIIGVTSRILDEHTVQ